MFTVPCSLFYVLFYVLFHVSRSPAQDMAQDMARDMGRNDCHRDFSGWYLVAVELRTNTSSLVNKKEKIQYP